MDIEKQLQLIIDKKQGNKELAIFFSPDSGTTTWNLSVGNPSSSVMLGEVAGELETYGTTLEQAILEMKILLNL